MFKLNSCAAAVAMKTKIVEKITKKEMKEKKKIFSANKGRQKGNANSITH